MHLRRLAIALAALSLFSGCASKAPPVQIPTIRTIAIVSASDPGVLTVEKPRLYAGLDYAGKARHQMEVAGMQDQLKFSLGVPTLRFGTSITDQVADTLRKAGFDVTILDYVSRSGPTQDEVDLRSLTYSADAVLQVRITRFGIYSTSKPNSYSPYLRVRGIMYAKSLPRPIVDAEVYAGTDASPGDVSQIVLNPNQEYVFYDMLSTRNQELKATLVTAGQKSAQQLATQVLEVIANARK